jgi:hypothetical protein
MLGNIWDSTEKKEFATNYYARIVRDYPLSPLVPDAKSRLKARGTPVPQADPKAVAWMTAEQNTPRPRVSLAKKPMNLLHNGPGQELRVAATQGRPTMTPISDSDVGVETLSGASPTGRGGTTTGIVATVPVGGSSGTSAGAENVAPSTESSAPDGGSQPDSNAAAADTAPKTDAAAGAGQTAEAASGKDGAQNGATGDNPKESTSKKKKGLRKMVPW